MKKILLLFLLMAFKDPSPLWAQCEPVSARVGVSGDDTTEVWVNGAYLGAKNYCDMGKGCHAESLFFTVPLQKLAGPQVCLAIKTANVNPVRVFSSWELVVDCAGAKPFVVTNEAKNGISLYWDPTGGANCGVGASPPVDNRGDIWTDLGYNPASNPFTLTGAPVTADTYTCAQVLNPLTGFILHYISYDGEAAGAGPGKACGVLYWRQVAPLPAWLPTSTPTASFTPTRSFTPTPPKPTMTFTPLPFFTFTPSLTPTPRPRLRRTPTPIPIRRPVSVAPVACRIRVKPTPTFVWRRPTLAPRGLFRPTWTPVPPPAPRKPAPVPTWLPPPAKGQAIVFETPPVEIYVTFGDGVGRYQLQVVDGQGHPLEVIFDKKIIGEKDSWVTWDGKDGQGRDVPPGQYFVIFYKNGKSLRSISVYRAVTR